MNTARTHNIERTSPFGEAFVGRCILCGTEGLKMGDALKECSNPRNVTEDESLIAAVKGTAPTEQ